jgi:hypothetical protein
MINNSNKSVSIYFYYYYYYNLKLFFHLKIKKKTFNRELHSIAINIHACDSLTKIDFLYYLKIFICAKREKKRIMIFIIIIIIINAFSTLFLFLSYNLCATEKRRH